MALHDLTDDIALPPPKEAGHENDDESAPIQMPSLMRTIYTGMRADGLYLIGTYFVLPPHGLTLNYFIY